MNDILIGLIVAVAAVLIFVAIRIYLLMQKATGTPWQRFMSVFRFSGTILWARIVAAFGFLTTLGANAADYLNASPALQDATRALFPPAAVPVYLVVIAVVFEYLRRQPVPANYPPVNAPLPPVAVPPTAPTTK